MTVIKCDPHAGPFERRALAPARFFEDQLEHIDHAAGVECADLAALAQKINAVLQRILTGRVRNFVDERLEYEREAVAARCPQGSGGNAQRHQGNPQLHIGYEFRRELIGVQIRAGRSLAVLAERNEMVAEGLQFSAAVETRLEEVKS